MILPKLFYLALNVENFSAFEAFTLNTLAFCEHVPLLWARGKNWCL